MTTKHSTSIHWSENDKEFIATCAEFPYLSGMGKTKEEALNILDEAIDIGIEMLIEDNEPVPKPLQINECSGNLRVRMPKSLHKSLKDKADFEGISLNQYIITLLASNSQSLETTKQFNSIQKSLDILIGSKENIKHEYHTHKHEYNISIQTETLGKFIESKTPGNLISFPILQESVKEG